MAYTDGQGNCDANHPVHVAQIVLDISYETRGTGRLQLSSKGIYSGHADYWDNWGHNAERMYVTECINGGHRCQARPPSRL